jgi:type VI secretion system FHA domain protein
MILTLEIIGSAAETLGAKRRKVFNATGGSIGRSPTSDWVLPDQFISSRHATVNYQRGVFYLEDAESTNGLFVNSPDNRLAKGQQHALKTGDLILIDPYEIAVSIADEPSLDVEPVAPVRRSAYPAPDDPFAPDSEGSGVAVSNMPSGFAGDPDDVVDPLEWLGGPKKASVNRAPRAEDLGGQSIEKINYDPPPLRADPHDDIADAVIPPNWLEDSGEIPSRTKGSSRQVPASRPPQQAAKRPTPPAPVRPPSNPVPLKGGESAGGELQAFLQGAGLENVSVTPDLARDFGEILRTVVAGVMDVLRTRQRLKSEFRMEMTMFKPADNNPLKFSANVEDALHNLLVKRNPAYLGPVDAFEDAFADVRNHQVAMLAGVRVAFEAMLAQFDPDRLQAEFDRQLKKGSLIPAPGKLRYWDLYRERIHDMLKDTETTFRELFGEEFARAYEEQLSTLKARGRAPKRQRT